jgi:hypothetical protein
MKGYDRSDELARGCRLENGFGCHRCTAVDIHCPVDFRPLFAIVIDDGNAQTWHLIIFHPFYHAVESKQINRRDPFSVKSGLVHFVNRISGSKKQPLLQWVYA